MFRREYRRPDSTLNGMDSFEGRCSVESGFMGVQWKGRLVRPMNGYYQYWKYMIRLDKGVCKRSRDVHDKRRRKIYKADRLRWDMVPWPVRYVPSSTRSNKESQLIFLSDSASLERLIRKGRRSSSIDNNTSSSLVSRQPPSTKTPVPSTDTRSPPSTEDTLLSTDIFHPTSIDTPVRTSIDTEP
ncbi:hypothetical protein F2Q68_00015888 [Brassica cretica]|uniref:Uncharacterized protein n=2 Tax=Brassica cretica TaxID=69181 RepID=A0ABQ7ES55_BRACR|nr:hypothetical protein F2Q68_00015888 [Brassica cretica]KAF3606414.1 hypothetical protein DY000_02048437 [Brassica cretica]